MSWTLDEVFRSVLTAACPGWAVNCAELQELFGQERLQGVLASEFLSGDIHAQSKLVQLSELCQCFGNINLLPLILNWKEDIGGQDYSIWNSDFCQGLIQRTEHRECLNLAGERSGLEIFMICTLDIPGSHRLWYASLDSRPSAVADSNIRLNLGQVVTAGLISGKNCRFQLKFRWNNIQRQEMIHYNIL